jgi:CarboxypepD_reg-like domain
VALSSTKHNVTFKKNQMKKNGYIIKMDKPCSEDWTSMTMNEIGKFCSNCSKNVVDFTDLTDDKIFQIIEQTNGNVCGRFKDEQLNRLLVQSNGYATNTHLSKLVAGLLLLSSTNNTTAHEQHSNIEIVSELNNANLSNNSKDVLTQNPLLSDDLKNVIRGQVLNSETKKPVSIAKVKLKGTDIGVFTDNNGIFEFYIPDSLLKEEMIFQVISNDQANEFTVAKKDLPLSKPLIIMRTETEAVKVETGKRILITSGAIVVDKIEKK